MPPLPIVNYNNHKTLRGPRGGLYFNGRGLDNPFVWKLKERDLRRKMVSFIGFGSFFQVIRRSFRAILLRQKAIAFGKKLDR